MKVLSIKEPYATLIKEKVKKIETRSWKTSYRGELYIHASVSKVTKENKELIPFIKDKNYSYGQIIYKVNLKDCIKMTKEWIEKLKKDNYQEYICGEYKEGRYAWILDDLEVLAYPIYSIGRLNIWDFNEEIMSKQ